MLGNKRSLLLFCKLQNVAKGLPIMGTHFDEDNDDNGGDDDNDDDKFLVELLSHLGDTFLKSGTLRPWAMMTPLSFKQHHHHHSY